MRYATRNLRDAIKKNPDWAKQFTKAQLADINAGSKNIAGLTWHHNGDGSTLQLVDRDDHANTGHDGSRKATGGRS
jgi:filamentous hemagglutinin